MIKAVGDTEVCSAYQGSPRLQPKGRGAQHSLRQAFQRHNPGNYIKEWNANVFLDILKSNFAESWRVRGKSKYKNDEWKKTSALPRKVSTSVDITTSRL